MQELHTHYDNLKVTRNAPPEVIRAAYKALVQKYHPDKHAGSDNAAKILLMINEAYAVLSDPDKKARHDAWIHQQLNRPQRPEPAALPRPRGHRHAREASRGQSPWLWITLLLALAVGLGVAMAVQLGGGGRWH